MVRCPLTTELPGWPGRAVPGIWPGPLFRASVVTPSTMIQSTPAAGMRMRPRASVGAGGSSLMMAGRSACRLGREVSSAGLVVEVGAVDPMVGSSSTGVVVVVVVVAACWAAAKSAASCSWASPVRAPLIQTSFTT